ncbi:tRNA (guanosine(37)-N1)-methyltransferase TrmD [Wolbachia endosymbiont of Brugia malayi]|uniref:tRNA (guanine-N(1)-)-methyltransferase n=1 Tax=Wolbachia sp. subsp. Brugia malayi (strain TRS) TaxID=292805 RepID=TRMD_WOLTR|nr:tRNA (guanosine(37)-N1)-methyltransferase TrmD [Wolbachia endosymbiont of Brugia malayi]Q5GT55.1 RecName: Full=tRNA (guanine-N(1)-)-methyltransferase; AltName: Full=M1G-methyltransferase; AltName: Full=tRNA [GM37] methyltransferase [Wolbachia endosymbiont strain TRS of Brugia malayi]AAW70819.1 tRNA-(guanine-N1)-methyltransferase [Wolbachia endosymbiont strain TRS of Brugia malayi]QCB61785.1 tRNA (guanosine(37)-N1)-methyltransferase TrmD [Wolbachia endosymbiont of Brugia malayi]
MFDVTILTIFPEMFPGFLNYSLAGKALEKKIWNLQVINIRFFAKDRHLTVDHIPYGGGAGMIMRPDVVGDAVDSVLSTHKDTKFIYMTPSGTKFDQSIARELVGFPHITILCGRFEGIDQRVIDEYTPYELSIGDYILSGGEPAAMVILDVCVRLLPGVVNNSGSITEESFSYSGGVLEYPQYTRPKQWRKHRVPKILLSGNHKKISDWRQKQSQVITKRRRPELLDGEINDKFT